MMIGDDDDHMSQASRPTYEILIRGDSSPERLAALDARVLPAGLRSPEEAATRYQPSDELVDAINVALAVGAPLLLTGEPGTGKTQVAYYLKHHFHAPLCKLEVRSSTSADDLFYHFDAVAYLHAAQDPARRGPDLDAVKRKLIEAGKGPLWDAFESSTTAVVLIDEIDKASRDFPNDLLGTLDRHAFLVKETGETITCKRPPVIVITSNSERRLPEPFLRRCVVHHIALDDALVRRAVEAHGADFQELTPDVRNAAIHRFHELRGLELRKRPGTAELLTWLAVLSARGKVDARQLRDRELHELPALGALIKDHDDLKMLGGPLR